MALAGLAAVATAGREVDAASVVNPVTPECRSLLFDAQRANETRVRDRKDIPETFLRYEACLNRVWSENLLWSKSALDDVDRLRDEVRKDALVIRENPACRSNSELTRVRDGSLKQAERARRQLASFVTVRDLIVSDYRKDLAKAWANGLLPGTFASWLKESNRFSREFGHGDLYDDVRLAAAEVARLKAAIRETIAQKEDC